VLACDEVLSRRTRVPGIVGSLSRSGVGNLAKMLRPMVARLRILGGGWRMDAAARWRSELDRKKMGAYSQPMPGNGGKG
jgi:hypothetical protein